MTLIGQKAVFGESNFYSIKALKKVFCVLYSDKNTWDVERTFEKLENTLLCVMVSYASLMLSPHPVWNMVLGV